MSRGPGAARTFSPLLGVLLFVGVSQLPMPGVAQAQVQSNGLPAPGMLPDHPLYFLKSASESVATLFTFGEVADGERSLDLAERRLSEASAKGVDADRLSARASVATLKHQAVLADVYERVPEAARPGIERAMQASMRGHEEAMSAISGEKREEAMRAVERQREESGPVLEELRKRGIPVPSVRTRQEVERGRPHRPKRERPEAAG